MLDINVRRHRRAHQCLLLVFDRLVYALLRPDGARVHSEVIWKREQVTNPFLEEKRRSSGVVHRRERPNFIPIFVML